MGLWWSLSDRTQFRIGKSAVYLGFIAMCAFGIWGVASALASREAVQPFAGGVVTRGTVVNVTEYDGRYDNHYTATVAFTDSSGAGHTFTAVTTTHPIEVGQFVEVSYVVTDPSRAHDLSARPDWQLGVVLGGLCAVTGSSALALGILRRRQFKHAVSGE